jgi:uncharacterized membrane protein
MGTSDKPSEDTNNNPNRPRKFFILFAIGFVMILVGIIILIAAALFSGVSMDFGAIIFIGLIPIVVGVGPHASWIVLFAIILALLSILMFLIIRMKTGRAKA